MSVVDVKRFDEMCLGRVDEILSYINHIPMEAQNSREVPEAVLLARCRVDINTLFLSLQATMDAYIKEVSPLPAGMTEATYIRPDVIRKSLVFSLRNRFVRSVTVHSYLYTTQAQLDMCVFTEGIFLSLFAETLSLPRITVYPQPSAHYPRQQGPKADQFTRSDGFEQPGPFDDDNVRHPDPAMDRHKSKGDEPFMMDGSSGAQGAEPRGAETQCQYQTIILENLHRRLTALEARSPCAL